LVRNDGLHDWVGSFREEEGCPHPMVPVEVGMPWVGEEGSAAQVA